MFEPLVCTPKEISSDLRVAAAQSAIIVNPSNRPHPAVLASAAKDGVLMPEHIAVMVSKRWPASGVRLTVGFLDNPPTDLRARIISHMNAWNKTANVTFVETARDAQVRIARASSGYWSYLGTDILHIAADQQTMNLQDFTMNTPDSEFHRVVRHETGHTLGFPHEHMRRELVNLIDPQKAISYFWQTQRWDENQVRAQVLTPLEESSLLGTAHDDAQSIMCYQLPGAITKNGQPIIGGTDIDAIDYDFIASIYPRVTTNNPTTGILRSGESLKPGQSIQSTNQRYTLILQTDGNVVLYNESRTPLWATNTGGRITPGMFIMQTDGNLVLYDNANHPQWASNTWRNPGAFFAVQDDGNLVVYRQGAQTLTAENAVWAAGSNAVHASQIGISASSLNAAL